MISKQRLTAGYKFVCKFIMAMTIFIWKSFTKSLNKLSREQLFINIFYSGIKSNQNFSFNQFYIFGYFQLFTTMFKLLVILLLLKCMPAIIFSSTFIIPPAHYSESSKCSSYWNSTFSSVDCLIFCSVFRPHFVQIQKIISVTSWISMNLLSIWQEYVCYGHHLI